MLARARQYFFDGKYSEGQQFVREQLLAPVIEPRSYQPLGDLRLTFDRVDEITNYRRDLNLDEAIATTSYDARGVTYIREVFASRADDVIIVHLAASQPGKISCSISLDRPDARTATREDGTLLLHGQAAHGTNHYGVVFEAHLRPVVTGGQVMPGDKVIRIARADEVTLVLAAATALLASLLR